MTDDPMVYLRFCTKVPAVRVVLLLRRPAEASGLLPVFGLAADGYQGKRKDILYQRAIVKDRTLVQRKVQNLLLAV